MNFWLALCATYEAAAVAKWSAWLGQALHSVLASTWLKLAVDKKSRCHPLNMSYLDVIPLDVRMPKKNNKKKTEKQKINKTKTKTQNKEFRIDLRCVRCSSICR